MTIFITLIIMYMLVSYFGVRIYFCFQNGLKDKKNSLSKLVFIYLIFFSVYSGRNTVCHFLSCMD